MFQPLIAAVLIAGCFVSASAQEAAAPASQPSPVEQLDSYIQSRFTELDVPSLAVAIVRGSDVVYQKVLGVADRESKRPADARTLYRIGSVTKVFTGTLLAILREKGVIGLDDPIAKYLPAELKLPSDPGGESSIRVMHLATHTSGLPRIPVNLPSDGDDPYGGYTLDAMLAGLGQCRLEYPVGDRYSYSNLGMGLLGHVLERAANKPYELLLKEYLLDPVGMAATAVTLNEKQKAQLATPYGEGGARAVDWNLGVLVPAGGIASNLEDLTRFVSLQLRAGEAGVSPISGGVLLAAQAPRVIEADWSGAVGLGWHIDPGEGGVGRILWHNGGMAGFHSYLALAPARNVGVIVLTNSGKSVDDLGEALIGDAAALFGGSKPRTIDPEMRRIVDELARHIVEAPGNDLADLFDPTFLAEIPLESVKGVLSGIAADLGPCKQAKIQAGDGPLHAIATYEFDGGHSIRCELYLNAAKPARIAGAQILPPDLD